MHLGEGPGAVYSVHNPSLSNTLRGVVERIFTVDYGSGQQQPHPQGEEEFRQCTGTAMKWLRRNVLGVRKFTVDEFIAHYDDPRIRTRYVNAAASLAQRSVERRDSDVKTFVKAEKVNFSAKTDPAPRIISPRDPRYNLALGLYVKPIEGALYKMLNEMCGGRTVMKGLNSLQVGGAIHEAWSSFSEPVAVACDAKRFDQHTRTAALRFEQRVYKLFFHGEQRDELSRLLSWQLRSKCRAYLDEAIVKFEMGIRASGDMNTGLGTCLIACALIHSYCVDAGLRYRLINNGDDCVILCEKQDLGLLGGFFDFCKTAGYHMVMETPVERIEEIDFCQTSPVLTTRGYVMVRQFPSSLGKDMVTLLPLTTDVLWEKWANDIGMCGKALNAGVPVLYAFYSALHRSGDGTFGSHPWLRGSGMVRNARGMSADPIPIDSSARISFYAAFGISPMQQVQLEQYYAGRRFTFRPGLEGYQTNCITNKPVHTFSNLLLTPSEV